MNIRNEMAPTQFYRDGKLNFTHDRAMNLSEYCSRFGLKPGQSLVVYEVPSESSNMHRRIIHIGDATPWHGLSESAVGKFEWDDKYLLTTWVGAVHEFNI